MTKNNKSKKSKSKKNQGRPSKLSSELQGEMIVLLKAGNFIETVCKTVGINKSTYYDWMKKGEKSNQSHNKYNIFQEAVNEAMAWSEAKDVAIITKHSEENWRAAAWKLSRKHPNKWGKKKYEDFDPDIYELDEDHLAISKKDFAVIKDALD